MKQEVAAAVLFLTKIIGKSGNLDQDKLEDFKRSLNELLMERFSDHWFPEDPNKGQAYRCIRVNVTVSKDPVLETAAEMCGLKYEELGMPMELTIWVDPSEVCCRFGEHHGSFCTIASFKDGKLDMTLSDIDLEELEKLSQQKRRKVPWKSTRNNNMSPTRKVNNNYYNWQQMQMNVEFDPMIGDMWYRTSPPSSPQKFGGQPYYHSNGSSSPPFSPTRQLNGSNRLPDRYHWNNKHPLIRA